MKPLLRYLFEPRGSISGRNYLVIGAILFVVKYLIDFALARLGFGFSWWPTDYFLPRPGRIEPGVNVPLHVLVALIAAALPFIWVGVTLTIKRLNAVGWPPFLAALFFVPYVNLLVFAILIFKRDALVIEDEIAEDRFRISGIFLVLAQSIFSIGLIALMTYFLKSYGWGLFVGIPFFLGFFPGLFAGPEGFRSALKLAFYSLLFVAGALILIHIEGLICLLMAAPLALVISWIGAMIGYAARGVSNLSSSRTEIGCVGILLLPILILAEAKTDRQPGLFSVTSAIHVQAPPQEVWNHVVSFPELPPPTELIFRAGIAYPIRAEIRGSGPGAIRHCVFSTGPFIEPIEIWEEPKLLRFSVSSNPAPMKELALSEIAPPHLHGFMNSELGQFELKALPGSGTELVGTTWYRHGLWPEFYWRLWSDEIIHTIHLRVLRHIKTQAEQNRF